MKRAVRKVQFYFDYNSPYSYFASFQIEDLCQRNGAELLWQPVVLGGIFKALDIVPAHLNDVKREYMYQDLERLSAYFQVPYQKRSTFLFNPILSLRATIAVPQGPDRAKAVRALFRGAFAENLDLGEKAVVLRLLGEAGLDADALVSRTQEQAVKDQLRTGTEQAVASGVFGAPMFLVDGTTMFWGQDRLPQLEHYLSNP